MTIFCLFAEVNEYDQHSDNLEAWWSTRPTISMIKEVYGDMSESNIIKLQIGKRVSPGGRYSYYLKELEEGAQLT